MGLVGYRMWDWWEIGCGIGGRCVTLVDLAALCIC